MCVLNVRDDDIEPDRIWMFLVRKTVRPRADCHPAYGQRAMQKEKPASLLPLGYSVASISSISSKIV